MEENKKVNTENNNEFVKIKLSKEELKAEKILEKEKKIANKEKLRDEKEKINIQFTDYKNSVRKHKERIKKETIEGKEEYRVKISELKGKIANLSSDEDIGKEESNLENLRKEFKTFLSDQKKKLRKGYYPIDEDIAIKLIGAYKYYITGDVINKVIDNLSLEIKRNETTIILGPSGSGKTTLLNLISGLDKPSAGDVITNNHNLSWISERKMINFRRENISFIFQQYNLIPTLNIEDNIRTGYEIKNKEADSIDINELMKRMDIYESRKKYPYQLSGGQLQRTAIARALAKNPDIIFADEPTGALDEEMSKEVLSILLKITKRYNKTLIIVTHNPQIAKIGNRILRFSNGTIVKDEVSKNPVDPMKLSW